MSRTTKQGKGARTKIPSAKPRGVDDAVKMRHTYGSTEKILRRNRKVWTRLGNKRRRAADKGSIEEGSE